MSEQTRQATLKMIPIASIEVLNPRERNQRIFDDIVGNIKQIGLKKPITVTSRPNADGEMRYLLVCGEGRMKAFKSLGETEIPAMVIDVDDAVYTGAGEAMPNQPAFVAVGLQRFEDATGIKPKRLERG